MINKMDKKGLQFQSFIISVLIFSGIIILFSVGIADMQGNYPDNPSITDEGFRSRYSNLEGQLDNITVMRETALSGEGLTFRGAFDVTFGSFFTIVQLVFGGLDAFASSLSNIGLDFPIISSEVLAVLISVGLAIITVLLILKFINAIGRNPI